MYECLIKKYNDDGSTSYEYWCDDGKPRCPHIPIPEGAEYFVCHDGLSHKPLIFNKEDFEYMWCVDDKDIKWTNSNWDDNVNDRLDYMKKTYGTVVLWKREDDMKDEYPDDVIVVTQNDDTILYWYSDGKVRSEYESERRLPMHKSYLNYLNDFPNAIVVYKREDKLMGEDEYLLTKLQACDVILSRTSVLQYQSTDGSWVDFKPSANKSNAQLYTILFILDVTSNLFLSQYYFSTDHKLIVSLPLVNISHGNDIVNNITVFPASKVD